MTYDQIQEFERFWNFYDKKIGKIKTEKLWAKLGRKEIEAIRITIKNYLEATPEKKYRKYPERYLSNKCWLDDISTVDQNKPVKRLLKNSKFSTGTPEEIEGIQRAYAKMRARPKEQRPRNSLVKQHIENMGQLATPKQEKEITFDEEKYQEYKKKWKGK